jgi:GNAT superfamily N-acetyltransferase
MILRELNEKDVSFVFSSYLKSLRPTKSTISNDIYYTYEHKRLERMLLNSVTAVLVDPVDDNHIIGYAIASVTDVEFILHYTYVKKQHREKGLAFVLLDAILDNVDKTLPRSCSNFTPAFIGLMNFYKFTYNPYFFDNSLGE